MVSAKEQIMEKKQMKLQVEMDECVNPHYKKIVN
jgi:hypothetical protein